MRFVAALALLVALGSCTRVVVVGPHHGDVGVETALKHTVHMVEGCTAVDVGGGWVLTAKHCTDENTFGDLMSVGLLMFQDPKLDYAVLYDAHRYENARACMRAPKLGEHVYAVGYPAQRVNRKQLLTVTSGVISTVTPAPSGEIRTSAPLYFGNSGGGLWGTDGCLLGITVSAFMDTAENYIVSAEHFPKVIYAQ